ncbi:DMT family transporter [Dermacoccus nishinomiyaensis]|uniref:DMT family transporter n=1 Tax=Dermacoccus nishinomiyaensis TaxID=1274 RepID=UPI000DB70067|nr:SMR family transporter [Dermacoccus nishinomiyaensis]PZP02804.1 MAG: QacE family quaternary ammonium compound efflux SMR transporter [Dermacoccus nishinomiyaensis]
MKNYLMLGCAVVCEVIGSSALKRAEQDATWFLLTLVADLVAFVLLALLLRRGMALSVVYGIWGALGVALTAFVGTVVFGEPFTLMMGCGVALVIGGVIMVEVGSDSQAPAEDGSSATMNEVRA